MLMIVSETVATFHVQRDVWLTCSRRDAEPLPLHVDDESNKSKCFSTVSVCPSTLFFACSWLCSM